MRTLASADSLLRKRGLRAAALAIFAAAAGLRLWQNDLTPFLDDEASLLRRGIELLDTGRIPLVGGTFSIGLREPPLMTFLLAPMLAVSRDPAWITACFGVLDAAAAVFVYLTARRLAGGFAGIAAGLIYAVAPAAIYFTRRTDYYGLVPFLVALTMLCLVRAWQERSAWDLAAALATTALALQLHPISAMLLPVWLLVAAGLWRRLPTHRPFAPALVLVALSLAPYAYLQAHSGWADAAALGRFLAAPKTADWSAPSQALTLIGGGIYQQLLLPRGTSAPLLDLDAAGWLLVALAAAGIGAPVATRVLLARQRQPAAASDTADRRSSGATPRRSRQGWPDRRRRASGITVGHVVTHAKSGVVSPGLARPSTGFGGGAWIAVALAALPVLAGVRHATGVLPYYMLPVIAPAGVLAGIALAAIPVRAVAIVLLATPVVWQGLGYIRFQEAVAENGPALDYGMPLRYERQAAGLLAAPSGTRVFVAQEGNQSASFPYLTGFRYQISHSDSRYGLALAAAPMSDVPYVVQAGGRPYDFLVSHFGQPSDAVETPGGKAVFGLFHLPTDALAAIESSVEITRVDMNVGSGIRLRGYAAPSITAGQPSPTLLEWSITNASASLPAEVQQFLHLVDGQRTTWSTNADERAYPRREWQSGDVVLSWFDLAPQASAPTGGYWLETGFYGYPTGATLGPGPRLGPVRLAGSNPRPGPARAVFGDRELALLAVDRSGSAVTLRWTALTKPRDDYTVFVHVLNAAGEVLAQHDGPPQDGAYPTTLWEAGDVVTDVHHLTGLAGGTQLEIGLYTRPSLRRLAAAAPNGADLGDHLLVPA